MKTTDQVIADFHRSALIEGLSRNTIRTYERTIREYHSMIVSGEIRGAQDYFNHLSTVKKLAHNSVRAALNPLKFLSEKTYGKEFKKDFRLPKRNTNRRIPPELSHTDIINILAHLERIPRLQASLLYGCGLRVESDMLKIRLKDVLVIQEGVLVIQEGKGDKSRTVRLPYAILGDLETQINACKKQWQRDRVKGIICPHNSESLMRKFGAKTFGTLPWYWLFPSRVVHVDKRWHSTDKCLNTGLKEASESLGITQRVHPHAFRHSYATNLLRSGVDIRTLQTQLGHSNVKTTEIYTAAAGIHGTTSPLDRPAPIHYHTFTRSA